jgi:hypothetical protein
LKKPRLYQSCSAEEEEKEEKKKKKNNAANKTQEMPNVHSNPRRRLCYPNRN